MDETIKEQLETMNQKVKELASIYRSAASKYGISDNEFWIWYALLVLGGEYSQQDICDMWSLPKQTVNSVVANWTKKRYVYLEAVPGTRNKKIIRLTEEGRAFGENLVLCTYQAEQRAFKNMSEQERKSCLALVGKYINLLKKELCDE